MTLSQAPKRHSSRISGLYQRSLPDRVALVAQWAGLDASEQATLLGMTGLNATQADQMIENVIGVYALPMGLATNFLINDKDYLIPMVIEEPSVVAACSFRDAYPQIEAKNAVVLGISPDDVESHKKFREALNLPFHLLVDNDFKISKAWDNFSTRTDDKGAVRNRTERGHYVIDENGKIVDAQNRVKAAESKKLAMEKL